MDRMSDEHKEAIRKIVKEKVDELLDRDLENIKVSSGENHIHVDIVRADEDEQRGVEEREEQLKRNFGD